MTAPSCTGSDDGLHRWRYGVSRLAGTPRYACDRCYVIALPTGDGVAEDYAYLGASGVVVRDDGLQPYRCTVEVGGYVEVTVMARSPEDAAELAPAEAEYHLGYAADRVADYGLSLALPGYVVEVAELAEEVTA